MARRRNEVETLLIADLPATCFTASSAGDAAKLAPSNARLHGHSGWRGAVGDKEPWLQVDMQRARLLLKVYVQGQGGSDSWMTSFKLLTSLDGVSWQTYGASAERVALVFPGNIDAEGVIEHALPVPVLTRFVRFCALSCHSDTAGMRVELCAREIGQPIGIAAGTIKNAAITASSERNAALGAIHARLGKDGAWQAREDDPAPFVEVDMGDVRLLSAVLMQGRKTSKGQWVTKFTIATRWHEAVEWQPYVDVKGHPIEFSGNHDMASVVGVLLPTLIFCRYVRIIATAWQDSASLRLELYTHAVGAPVGLLSGALPNAQITATTHLDESSVPGNARLFGKEGWSAKGDRDQYLQIDLGELKLVTAVLTQGRKGQFEYWTKTYTLEGTLDDKRWFPYKVPGAMSAVVFPANKDTDTVAINALAIPFLCRKLRIKPVQVHRRHTLRAEVFVTLPGHPIGLEHGALPRGLSCPQILAAPTARNNPDFARLNDARGPGWISSVAAQTEYLQIDLQAPQKIAGLLLQGCPGNWLLRVAISLSNDGNIWQQYSESQGAVQYFDACTDADTIVPLFLYAQPTARFLRVHPGSWHGGIACRLEILTVSAAAGIAKRAPAAMAAFK
eukprot:m.246577 g.246577  ORF g.246577 m.246577 type:complete len:618 (+) comp15083_c0_seq1:13-1866(+)